MSLASTCSCDDCTRREAILREGDRDRDPCAALSYGRATQLTYQVMHQCDPERCAGSGRGVPREQPGNPLSQTFKVSMPGERACSAIPMVPMPPVRERRASGC